MSLNFTLFRSNSLFSVVFVLFLHRNETQRHNNRQDGDETRSAGESGQFVQFKDSKSTDVMPISHPVHAGRRFFPS